MTLIHGHGLTIEDLEAMPDDGRRYELIGGSIVVNASPAPRHQRALGALYRLVHQACPAGHEVMFSPIDLDLPGPQRVEPDLIVIPHSSVGPKRLSLPVLLVVELISPTSVHWDLIIKRDAYAEAGIPHYWTIDTREGHEQFVAWTLAPGSDRYDVTITDANRIDVGDPIGVSTPLSALFAR